MNDGRIDIGQLLMRIAVSMLLIRTAITFIHAARKGVTLYAPNTVARSVGKAVEPWQPFGLAAVLWATAGSCNSAEGVVDGLSGKASEAKGGETDRPSRIATMEGPNRYRGI